MSNNASNKTASSSGVTPRISRLTTTGSQMTYEERCTDIEGHTDILEKLTARTKGALEFVQEEILAKENSPEIEDLRHDANLYRSEIMAIEAALKALVEKSETLDAKLKNELSDVAERIVQDAEKAGVVFGREDGETK